ncbi:histidine phosphatase family protein [Sulfitobacter geojensis]|uniref:histidine phosphatase family protein n=1 Tax=Sulfitobacter geojensis TaxID=1342299 RepID=UPI00046AF766|nr:histidine phosphatase family protein [Sulfitobacter geojensis]KHA51143.1 Phosphoglycerate mutase family protein [Sulfitobacter geojensis]NYI26491.1 putative phosphoglycerate mutase [Sulfitobacter geojensis]
MIRLALLRHGHTEWNRAGRIQGRTDIPLDAEAKRDLSKLMLPAAWQEATVFSSPLSRAADTARIVAGKEPHTVPALIEMNWGAWEGKFGKEMRADPDSGYRDIETWGWNYTPPGGEPPLALLNRLEPWVAQLHGNSIAVCHIGVMRVLLARATGWQFDGPAPFQIKRNRLYIIEITGKDWHLQNEPVRLVARPT